MDYKYSEIFALEQDKKDPLAHFRSKFFIPEFNERESVYFCGNSLGLQPKSVEDYIKQELLIWRNYAVEGHFKGKTPWVSYQKLTKKALCNLMGAKTNEVVSMGSLTGNLHNLLVSFYNPVSSRYKVITEYKNFPSDAYALETQVKFHGLDPHQAIIEVKPQDGSALLTTRDIIACIEEHAEELALVMMSGVHYYTGQVFNMAAITAAAHKYGAYAGFDLAHAAGNIPLKLHEWEVDFAAWCGYKYLNSGPGGMAGIFVHEKHGQNNNLNRFAGWWGHREGERFQMEKGFLPMEGADGWQQSNVNIISTAVHRASLDIFEEAGIEQLREKSIRLTGYLQFIIDEINKKEHLVDIITPFEIDQRGCQLSLIIRKEGKRVFDFLSSKGVIADWREPSVIRVAPVPLYNSFMDVYRFGKILEEALKGLQLA